MLFKIMMFKKMMLKIKLKKKKMTKRIKNIYVVILPNSKGFFMILGINSKPFKSKYSNPTINTNKKINLAVVKIIGSPIK